MLTLRELYYTPRWYYRSVEKFHEEVKKQGYNFDLSDDVHDFLHRQVVWQVNAPHPKYISYASFTAIPNEVNMSDI